MMLFINYIQCKRDGIKANLFRSPWNLQYWVVKILYLSPPLSRGYVQHT